MNHLPEFVERCAFVIPASEENDGLLEGFQGTDSGYRCRSFGVIIVLHTTFRCDQFETVRQGAKTL